MVRSDAAGERMARAARRLLERGAAAGTGPEGFSAPPSAPRRPDGDLPDSLAPRATSAEQELAAIRAAYEGVRLADRYEVTEARTAVGRYLRLRSPSSIGAVGLPDPARARAVLSSRLDLVWGIGPRHWAELRRRGVRTVFDLAGTGSPAMYRSGAAEVLAELGDRDPLALHERMRRRLGARGQVLAALLAATVGVADIGFLDVETLGLHHEPIFLVGVGRIEGATLVVDQYLAPRPSDEPAALGAALGALAGVRLLVTYNGRAADVPWILARCFYHGLSPLRPVAHLDLLHGARRRWISDEPRLPDARLPTVQRELLGLERPEHDVPSVLVPRCYDAYTAAPEDECLLVPIIDHNRSDIEALASLLGLLCAEALALDGPSEG